MSCQRRGEAWIILVICAVLTTNLNAVPVRDIPDLTSITFWETTGSLHAYTFGVNSVQLISRLPDPLDGSNYDMQGVPGREFYDIHYSNADGGFNVDGEYLTISGVYDAAWPYGGGLNLAEIGLNFVGTPTEYGNYVASYVALGNNAIPSSVGLAIDGDLLTCTTMGNTIGQTDRLRVTLGFLSSSGPVIPAPGAIVLTGIGAGLVRWLRRNRLF